MASEKATERKLIFINLLNGVSIAEVAKTFHKETEKEVLDEFRFVALKIKSYLFQRAMPYIPFDTVAEARSNRVQFLILVDKLNLDVVPVFSRIVTQKVEEVYA
jgi:hypothetical protein